MSEFVNHHWTNAKAKQHIESLLLFLYSRCSEQGFRVGQKLESDIVGTQPYVYILPYPQVQNMTQSIQVLDQRTQRDLQYVEKMEVQLRGLETKFRQVEENHKQNIAKQYKV